MSGRKPWQRSRGSSEFRELVEQPEFHACIDPLRYNDRAMRTFRGLTWGIAKAPHLFPEVDGYPGIRLAKSDADALPDARMMIWFQIKDDDTVYLWYIEYHEDGEG